ncbi:type II toxin-antitoxin system VapC family toxin [Candidatus Poriferisocius sp.]|uniref:type II toxin-antitoxin system VapC family toxin n=1 Tax=Candidatus Poriferisocius sp. TaxID=3101276 RepID=UPI003B013B6C
MDCRTKRQDEDRAVTALSDLALWPIDRISHRALALLAWQHYSNIRSYDAFYVATTRALGVPLLTADGRLARSPGLDITVHHIQIN